MDKKLRILILEDVPADAELVERELRKGGMKFSSKRVDTRKAFLKELKDFEPDLILGDYNLPSFDGITALGIVLEKCPEVPFIFISGSIGEELAIETLKKGATDYVLKDRLSRLVPAVIRALREVEERTERKQAEMELNKERDRAQRYLDIAGVMLVAINIDQEVILINRKGCEILGYKEDEIIGRNWFDRFIPERDRKNVKAVFAKLVAAEIEPVEQFENTVLTKSGMEKIIAWHNTIITDESGHIMGTLSSGEDITERKRAEKTLQESENRYRQVVENATEIIYTVDEKGNFTYANRAGLKVIGYSLGELRKLNYADLVVPGHRERVSQVYTNQFRERLPTTYVEFPFLGKAGKIIWFGQNSTLVMDGDKIVGFHIIARDITERKQAEEVIKGLARFPSENPSPVLRIEREGTLLYANEVSYVLLRDWQLEIGGPAPFVLRKAVSEALTQQIGKTIDTELGQRTISFSVAPVVTAGYANFYGRDITERKLAEEALRKSEQRYRNLVETAPDVIYTLAADGTITSLNPAFEKITGWLQSDWLGKQFIFILHPDDLSRSLEFFHRILKGERIEPFQLRVLRKSGDYLVAEFTVTPQTQDESVIGILGIARDITERKRDEEALRESEERYRTVIEHSNDGVAIDRGSQRLFVNQRFVEIFGYDKPEEMVGKPLSLMVHPDDIKRLEEIILRRQRGEVIPSRYEFRGLRKNGETIDVEASATRTNYRGESVSLVYLRDITDRKRAEEALRQTEEQLRQSQKMEAIGQLAGGVAHDFNNILTVIKGYSQLSLNEIKEGEPLRENIEEIKKASDRAADLTRQLLAFSRRQIMEMKVLDLNDLLVSLEKMLRRVIGEDIELVTLLTEDLGRVKTDPGQIEQVIMNLAVNARDAMRDGGRLTIETANVDLDEDYARRHVAVIPGRYVMISVSDTGVGMTSEVRDRVFDPFFTTKEKGKGTGLGLSTVYGIVKQSGGNIWVYSEPGKGTTLKIYLPRVDEPPEELKEKVVIGELPRGSETILVVEDEEDVRKLAVRILERQGYKVLEASEGLGAFLLVEEYEGPIHLLVTDVVMPKLSGRELVDRIAGIRPEIKVLYMSGYTDNAITHHGILEKGMNYLQKPFTMEGLARKVREVLDK